MVRTQIQLTEEQADALRQRAARERVSISELVRRAVSRLLDEASDDRWARFDAAAGAFSSGHSDMSERHDDYFVEAIAGDD